MPPPAHSSSFDERACRTQGWRLRFSRSPALGSEVTWRRECPVRIRSCSRRRRREHLRIRTGHSRRHVTSEPRAGDRENRSRQPWVRQALSSKLELWAGGGISYGRQPWVRGGIQARSSRRTRLRTLPEALRGSSSTATVRFGIL